MGPTCVVLYFPVCGKNEWIRRNLLFTQKERKCARKRNVLKLEVGRKRQLRLLPFARPLSMASGVSRTDGIRGSDTQGLVQAFESLRSKRILFREHFWQRVWAHGGGG